MQPTSVAILAGGQARRFGSKAKGLALFRGRPVIEHQLAALTPNASRVALIGDRLSEFDALIAKHQLDRVGDVAAEVGPMAGLVAGLEWSPTPWLFVVAADLPLLDWRVALALAAPLTDADPPKLIAPVVDARVQPLAALYNRAMLDEAKHCLEQRLLSPRRLFDSAHAKQVSLDPVLTSLLRGFNTVSELRDLEASAS